MLNTPHNSDNVDDNINELSLGELILIARNRANLSQEDLAKRAHLGRMAVWRYEKGHSIPNCDRLERIAKAVNHPIDWFYQ